MKTCFILKAILLQVLLVLSFFSSPAFACSCRDKVSSVKANMHTFQTALETYAVDHGGIYPKSAELLETEAEAQHYWKQFKNPYINRYGYKRSFGNMNEWEKSEAYKYESAGYFWGLRVRWKDTDPVKKPQYVTPGIVLYEYVKPTHYRIYGVDGKGAIIKDRSYRFYLSNE